MSDDSTKPGLSRLATAVFAGCFIAITYFLYRILAPFLSALIWAVVLTVVFFPLFKFVLARLHGRRTAASSITCLLILLLIVLPVTFLGVLITQQSIALYQSIQGNAVFLGAVTERLQELQSRPAFQWLASQTQKWMGFGRVDVQAYLREALSNISRFLMDYGPSVLKGVGGLIFNFFLMLLTMFFLLRDGPALMAIIRSSSPLPEAYELEIFKKFEDVSYAIFYGSLLTAVAQGAAAFLLFLVLGLPAPLFWGAMISLVSLVPVVGAFLIGRPWAAYLLLAGQTVRGIVLLAVGGLVVSSIDNVLKPIIIKGRTDMHPLLVFLSVLGGLQVFGFLGVLLGPLLVALFVSFLHFYREEFQETLRRKKAPADANAGTDR
jgi:predicted PurR-regulated permease PerM